jgi:hypothetical protein
MPTDIFTVVRRSSIASGKSPDAITTGLVLTAFGLAMATLSIGLEPSPCEIGPRLDLGGQLVATHLKETTASPVWVWKIRT